MYLCVSYALYVHTDLFCCSVYMESDHCADPNQLSCPPAAISPCRSGPVLIPDPAILLFLPHSGIVSDTGHFVLGKTPFGTDIIWILNLLRWVPVLGFFGLTSTVTRQPSKRPKFSKSLSSPLANSHLVRWSSSWPEQKKYICSP